MQIIYPMKKCQIYHKAEDLFYIDEYIFLDK